MTKQNSFFFMVIALVLLISGCSTKPKLEKEPLSLQSARYAHAAVNDGKHIYVLAGSYKDKFLSDIEIIEPTTGHTAVLKDKLIPRRYFSAVWDGKESIYILGGVSLEDNKFRYEKRVEVFNTVTHEVTLVNPLPAPTRINTAVFKDGQIFVFGGAHPSKDGFKASAITAVFDIKNNKWMRAADMPTAKTTRAFVKDEYIYVVGGYDRSNALNVFERFDPKTNKWQSLAPMPVNISAHSISIVDEQLFVFGDYKELQSTYRYDFDTKLWQQIDIGYKASRHNAATTLHDKTYVIGGNTGGSGPFLDYVQVFELKN